MTTSMQICTDTRECQALYEPQGLYLKPVAKVTVSVQLPMFKMPGKSISNWEVMEKIKSAIKPNVFTSLKVSKSTLEFIRFEGEAENKTHLKNIISRLDNRTIKLSGFPELLRVRAAEAKISYPTRHDWDSFFREGRNVDELKPGDRPDTIHFNQLPCRWFADKKASTQDTPSEEVVMKVFSTFGPVRCVDIPMLDPYRREMTGNSSGIQTFSFGQDLTFEAFVQYQEYIGFVKAMDTFKGMKLMYKNEERKCFSSNVKVDFDRTSHLSENNIKKRLVEREKLIQLEREREERVKKEREAEGKKKEEERLRHEAEEKERELKREVKLQKREEKKKQRKEEKKRQEEERRRKEEERKLALYLSMKERAKMEASRKAAAQRLLTVLFDKVKVVKQKEEIRLRIALEREKLQQTREEKRKQEIESKRQQAVTISESKRQKDELTRQELTLREKILNNLQQRQEEEQRERLRQELTGRTKLKSVLVKNEQTSAQIIPKLKSVLVSNL